MPLTEHEIAAQLLHYLQLAFDDASLRYHDPPTLLTGGYSSQLFKFQLDTSGVLAQPLVIRIYTSSLFPPGQAFVEGEIQNLLASEGYPTAPVHSICEDTSFLGHEFIIMQFMPGEMIIKTLPFEQVATKSAEAHAKLHTLNMDTLTRKLRLKGFYTRNHLGLFTSSFTMILNDLESRITVRRLVYLWPALEWIQQNRSIAGNDIVINHCDFHPLNILVNNGDISAVLDWQGCRLGEPEFDVTNSIIKLHCYAPILLPQYQWSVFIKRYLADYHQISPLNAEKVRYYQAVWCIRCIVNLSYGSPRLKNPQIRKCLIDQFNAITGSEIAS